MSARAQDACVVYDGWATEVTRLTAAIADSECPLRATPEEIVLQHAPSSCFAEAREGYVVENSLGEERRRTLDEIGEAVADCEACSQLVVDIRDRLFARQRFGVAKREVRSVARAALT